MRPRYTSDTETTQYVSHRIVVSSARYTRRSLKSAKTCPRKAPYRFSTGIRRWVSQRSNRRWVLWANPARPTT
jgi:hypothetical protein